MRRIGSAMPLILVMMLLLSSLGRAEERSLYQMHKHADRALKRGRAREAVLQYRELARFGVRAASLEHNLAAAYQAEGDHARALAHYARALHYQPRNQLVRTHMTTLATQATDDTLPLWEIVFRSRLVKKLTVWLLLIGMLLTLGCLKMRRFLLRKVSRRKGPRRNLPRRINRIVLAAGMACIVLTGSAFLTQKYLAGLGAPAIVVQTTRMRESADIDTASDRELVVGTLVRLKAKRRGVHRLISLDSERTGWIERSAVASLLPLR